MLQAPSGRGASPRVLVLVRRWVAALAVPVLAACSPTDVLNTWAPTERTRAVEGVAYGPEARQRLDVYRPADAAGANAACSTSAK